MRIKKNYLFNILIAFILATGLIFIGCGGGDEEEKADLSNVCASGQCMDLTGASNTIEINDYPKEYQGLPDKYYGYKFNTSSGYTYTAVVDASNGEVAHLYVSDSAILDMQNPTYSEYCLSGKCTLEFMSAKNGYHYIVLKSGSDQEGLDYSIRVFSYDEKLSPLSDTYSINKDGNEVSFSLTKNQIKRYYFSTYTGNDYTIEANSNNDMCLYVSRIPSVDHDTSEFDDCNFLSGSATITFRATKSTTYYVGVKDGENTTGSECTLTIHEE